MRENAKLLANVWWSCCSSTRCSACWISCQRLASVASLLPVWAKVCRQNLSWFVVTKFQSPPKKTVPREATGKFARVSSACIFWAVSLGCRYTAMMVKHPFGENSFSIPSLPGSKTDHCLCEFLGKWCCRKLDLIQMAMPPENGPIPDEKIVHSARICSSRMPCLAWHSLVSVRMTQSNSLATRLCTWRWVQRLSYAQSERTFQVAALNGFSHNRGWSPAQGETGFEHAGEESPGESP